MCLRYFLLIFRNDIIGISIDRHFLLAFTVMLGGKRQKDDWLREGCTLFIVTFINYFSLFGEEYTLDLKICTVHRISTVSGSIKV